MPSVTRMIEWAPLRFRPNWSKITLRFGSKIPGRAFRKISANGSSIHFLRPKRSGRAPARDSPSPARLLWTNTVGSFVLNRAVEKARPSLSNFQLDADDGFRFYQKEGHLRR